MYEPDRITIANVLQLLARAKELEGYAEISDPVSADDLRRVARRLVQEAEKIAKGPPAP